MFWLFFLLILLGIIVAIIAVKWTRKGPIFYGLLFSLILYAWTLAGMNYSLGLWRLVDAILPEPASLALSYLISGPFLLLFEYLGGQTYLIVKTLALLVLGFAAGCLLGLVKIRFVVRA